MYLIVPTTKNTLYYKYNITIENKTYIFIFHYNGRMSRWTLGIYDYREVPILTGITLVTGVNLLWNSVSEDVPAGSLYWFGINDLYEEGGITSPGNTHLLIYKESTTT